VNRFAGGSAFQWVENLWKKELIEKHSCSVYFMSILNVGTAICSINLGAKKSKIMIF